jgi:hypothetical protein
MSNYSSFYMQLDIGKQPKQETQTPQRQTLSDQDDPWCERHDQPLTHYSKYGRTWYAHYDRQTDAGSQPRR